MSLYDAWKRQAYDTQGLAVKRVWNAYLPREKGIYKEILCEKLTHIEGTVTALAERFKVSPMYICAFLDGIYEAVDGLPPIETLTDDTAITLELDFERLYQKMVEYKAKELYTLPEWNDILTPERQEVLYRAQKAARTVVRETAKVRRNEPCPCGSGKKYKKCCGAV